MSTEPAPEVVLPEINWKRVWQGLQSRGALLAIVALLAFFVHLRGVVNGFVEWDDPEYVMQNGLIMNRSWTGFQKLWTVDAYMGYYHPVTLSALWAIHSVAGMSAPAYHLADVVLHTATACLLFLLVAQITRSSLAALVAGALFAVHPVQVEVVAWVSETKTLLSTAFMLLSFFLYLKADAQGRGGRLAMFYAASVVCQVVAGLAKPSALMLPVMIGLYYATYWRRSAQQAGKQVSVPAALPRIAAMLVPFTILSIILFIITVKAHAQVPSLPRIGGSFGPWALAASTVLWKYIQWWLIPQGYSALYALPFASVNTGSFQLLSFLMAGGLVAAVIYYGRRRPAVGFWGGWFLLNFIPISGIVPFPTLMQDRYLYVMAPGAAALCGVGLAALVAHRPGLRWSAGVAAALIVVFLSVATVERTGVWRDSLTLWKTTVARLTGQPIPGQSQLEQEATAGTMLTAGALPESTSSFRQYVLTSFGKARGNLAVSYWRDRNLEKLSEQAKRGLHEWPLNPRSTNLLALYWEEHDQVQRAARIVGAALQRALQQGIEVPGLLRTMGRLSGRQAEQLKKQGDLDGAEQAFQAAERYFGQALTVSEGAADATLVHKVYRELGVLYAKHGEPSRAADYFERALKRNANDAESHCGLGVALKDLNKVSEALQHWRIAVRLDPRHVRSWRFIAQVSAERNDIDLALAAYQQATRLASEDWQPWLEYGRAATRAGAIGPALTAYRQVTRLRPDLWQPWAELGRLASAGGVFTAEAQAAFRQALQLRPNDWRLYVQYGHRAFLTGMLPSALRAAQRAVALAPQEPNPHILLAKVLIASGQKDDGLDQFQVALQIDPKRAATHEELAHTWLDLDSSDKAIEAFQKAIDLSSDPRVVQQLKAKLDAVRRGQETGAASPSPAVPAAGTSAAGTAPKPAPAGSVP